MRFSDLYDQEDPAYAIFCAAMDTVFDKDDGTTEHIHRLSQEARSVYLLWCFDGEINNGGFEQFFSNSLGDHSLEILTHLEAVGATVSRDLLLSAVSWFPESRPAQDQDGRWVQLEGFAEDPHYLTEIDRWDSTFFEGGDDLHALITSFVLQRPDASIKV